jgi:Uma2 family endonuclease
MTIATQAQAETRWPRTSDLPLVLRLRPVLDLTDDQLLALSSLNRDLRLERTAEGDLLLMPPTGGETGATNAQFTIQLGVWAKRDGTGTTFDSSTGFKLPNTAVRSPDAAWMSHARLDQFTREQRKSFIPACPDFVLELRSPSDTLADLHAKLREYIANGARLGWLLDPETRRVYVYRPDAPVQQLDDPATVSGDPVLPGFVLKLGEVW